MAHVQPDTMPDDVFRACSLWAFRMDQAVYGEGDLPTEKPPLFYDSFRRANPKAIDPALALNMQRAHFLAEKAAKVAIPAEPEKVSLSAVDRLFNNARELLKDSQRMSQQQMETAVKALSQAARPAHPRPGYERRVMNRRERGLPPPRRPRNGIRADRGHQHVHVPLALFDLHDHAHGDDPPPYRRHRRAPRREPPRHDHQCNHTPHPIEGFLFQGAGAEAVDEDQVMRDETPFDFGGMAGPAPPLPAEFANARATREDTPDGTNASVTGTATPRARSPTPAAAPEASGSGQHIAPLVPPGLGLEDGLAAPANSEYAGSVTDGLDQLDLGAADQLLNAFLNPEVVPQA